MPANVYECMFLLDTAKVAGDIPSAADQLHTLLEKHSAEILASRPWDERRLAYQIENHKKGLYYLTYFRTEGDNIPKMENDFRLNEMIIRHLVIRIDDPKLVETMLALARDEHALVALHNYQDDQSDSGPPSRDRDRDRDRDRGDRGDRGDREARGGDREPRAGGDREPRTGDREPRAGAGRGPRPARREGATEEGGGE